MSYTDPTIRATGDLITASIWNTDLVNNFKANGMIQRGTASLTDSGAGALTTVTFTQSYSAAPKVTIGPYANHTTWIQSTSTTQVVLAGSGAGTWSVDWIAIGNP